MRLWFPALLLFTALLWLAGGISDRAGAQDATPDPDLQTQNVPHGKTTNYVFKHSRVYPGTEHNYTVYVPAQYHADHATCVMIFQDGLGFNAPTVFDNLIAKKQMPVTIAIGISPGVAPPARPGALPRYNRSVEYDTPDDTYARFLLNEILPEVGKTLNLSQDPNDRGLVGASSGGIAAFTVAWERPDQFRRVYSVVGSFTDLAGGDTYPSKIRKSEPKPLRIYLQDNDHDQDIYSGSWPLSNEEVAAALKYAGYDYKYVVGQGGHDGGPGSRMFPSVLRWLWRDYPAPIVANMTTGQPVTQILAPGEGWHEVPITAADRGYMTMAANPAGDVFVSRRINNGIVQIHADDSSTDLTSSKEALYAIAATPDGHILAGDVEHKTILDFDMRGGKTVLARGVSALALVASHQGTLYYLDGNGEIQILNKNGRKRLAYDPHEPYSALQRMVQPKRMFGVTLTLTPDQSLLIASGGEPRKALTSWRIQPDGTLKDGQPFFDLTTAYNQAESGAAALATDAKGWLYVATPAGIQVCDQAGRVNGIIAVPDRNARITGMTFGGPNHDTLYVACNSNVFKRKLRVKGVLPFDAPLTPPGPRL